MRLLKGMQTLTEEMAEAEFFPVVLLACQYEDSGRLNEDEVAVFSKIEDLPTYKALDIYERMRFLLDGKIAELRLKRLGESDGIPD